MKLGLFSFESNQNKEEMVWNYPEISKEDFIKLLKGFVDLLILASGFQSSGVPSHWDAENCKKALQWGLFFENVLRSINGSDTFGESVRELDEAISEIKSNPLFPKGLENLSSDTLSKGREFVLEHLMNNSTLKDKQLRAILVAAVESGDGIREIIDGKLCKRQSVVSCVSALETGLNILSKHIEPKELLHREDNNTTFLSSEKQPIELLTWNIWQSKAISYFLSKRTLRLVSGASLIFSAPKAQWVEVLRRLRGSDKNDDDIFIEKIELLLIGCVTSRWTHLIEGIMSVSYKSVTVSEQYEELCKLLLQRSKSLKQNEIALNSKVEEILEYLTEILESRLHHLWKLPSALTAAAIPSWSPLFGLYFGEIEKQLKLDHSTTRSSFSLNISFTLFLNLNS
ncbi:Fanconi anemia group F protein [Arabidopsis suecica]|uniref:Fanconi anemia group F protein n=1 Tax=Arabidopsis suecica TaxID=45249 RepID=A0A8T1XXB4_ARASU|nr:Fanconi anemia group F protein [Arabidopsis suecica]